MTPNNDPVLRFLDSDLDAAEEARLLHEIAEDGKARSLLRFDGRLRRALDSHPADPIEVPRDFAARVMASIASLEGVPEGEGIWERLKGLLDALFRPQLLPWRPAYAVAFGVALILGGLLLTTLNSSDGQMSTTPPTTASDDVVWVRFAFSIPAASSVAVAGDFSYWKPVALTPAGTSGQQVWTGSIPVPRGEHGYMFLIDGSRWVTDPLAPVVRDDGFGNRNSILSL